MRSPGSRPAGSDWPRSLRALSIPYIRRWTLTRRKNATTVSLIPIPRSRRPHFPEPSPSEHSTCYPAILSGSIAFSDRRQSAERQRTSDDFSLICCSPVSCFLLLQSDIPMCCILGTRAVNCILRLDEILVCSSALEQTQAENAQNLPRKEANDKLAWLN